MKIWLFLAMAMLMSTTAFGAAPGDVLGLWKTDGGDSHLELFKCGEKICGKIVWLKVPNYIDNKDGPVGKVKTDRKNPDRALRSRSILGLQVMKGFTSKGANRWVSGTAYNPETGKSYRSKMYLATPDRLELRGYMGISLIGRTTILSRLTSIASNTLSD